MRPFKLLLGLCIIFMIVFPYGKIGPLPIKFMLLLLMLWTGFLTLFLINKKVRFDLLIFIFFFSFVFPMIWLMIGLLNNNPLGNIIDFVNVFPLLSILFFVYLLYDKESFKGFLHLLTNSISLVAFLTIILFIVYLFLDPVSRAVVSSFLLPSGLGSNIYITSTGLVRIILRSNVFIPVNLFMLLAVMRYDGGFKWKLLFLINFCAIFIGFNKAFFIGLIPAGIFFLLFQGVVKFKRTFIRDPMIKAMVVMLVLIALSPLFYRVAGEVAEGLDMSSPSNSVRFEQAEYLFDNIERAPLWGAGFGAMGKNYRGIKLVRDFTVTQYFELEYVHLLFQLGYLGFFIFGLFLASPILIYFYNYDKFGPNRYLCSAFISGYVAYLFYAGTNPYIMGSSGFLVIVTAYLVVIFSKKYSNTAILAPLKEN